MELLLDLTELSTLELEASARSVMYALTSQGELLWNYSVPEVPTHDAIEGFPTIGEDGTIYFGTRYLYAISHWFFFMEI